MSMLAMAAAPCLPAMAMAVLHPLPASFSWHARRPSPAMSPLLSQGPRLRHRRSLPPALAQLNDQSSASSSSSPPQLYPGVYGPWSLDSADVREVNCIATQGIASLSLIFKINYVNFFVLPYLQPCPCSVA